MNIEVELPDLGDTAGDQATVSEWHFEEGDFVEEGEYLVEVVAEDDTIEVPSPAPGILIEISASEGDLVRVGDLLALLEARDDADFIGDEDDDD